ALPISGAFGEIILTALRGSSPSIIKSVAFLPINSVITVYIVCSGPIKNIPDKTINISSTNNVRTMSQPNPLLNIIAIILVPPLELPVRKIKPLPTPIKKPANTADTNGSPKDSTRSSVIQIKNEIIGTVMMDNNNARFGNDLKPISMITDVRMNVTIPGDQPKPSCSIIAKPRTPPTANSLGIASIVKANAYPKQPIVIMPMSNASFFISTPPISFPYIYPMSTLMLYA